MLPLVRRLSAALLLLSPLQGTAVAFASPTAASHCADGVCECRRHCEMQKQKARTRGCHESAPAGPFSMTSRCGHRAEVTVPASAEPHVVPPASSLAGLPVAVPYGVRVRAPRAPGFPPVETPPPKAAV